MFWSFVICFYFSWQLACVSFFVAPIIFFCEALQGGKELHKDIEAAESQRYANLLASDSIQNYKTIAACGSEDVIAKEFHSLL